MARTKATTDVDEAAGAQEVIAESFPGTEIAETVAEVMPASMTQIYDNAQMKKIETWDDALQAILTEFGEAVSAERELGNGFAILTNKDRVCGVPLIFLEWTFHPSNIGDKGEFVSVKTVARFEGGVTGKYIINDGSSGIYQSLREYTDETGRTGGMICRGGLRKSEYDYKDPKTGELKPASTYYIETAVA